jgi:hypothetical protein
MSPVHHHEHHIPFQKPWQKFVFRKEKAEMENDISIGGFRQSPLGTSDKAAPLFRLAFEALTKTSSSLYPYFRSDVGKG